jgi:hypothetical protein
MTIDALIKSNAAPVRGETDRLLFLMIEQASSRMRNCQIAIDNGPDGDRAAPDARVFSP